MTTIAMTLDILTDSQRLLAALEGVYTDQPVVEEALLAHRTLHHELEKSSVLSTQKVEAWRTALAQRWEQEVSGRRLYKRVIRQYAEFYGGPTAPEVLALTRGEAEANSTPAELLADMRRVQAALSVSGVQPARELLPNLEAACAALEEAIAAANRAETERRVAALDHRMAGEAYRRLRKVTQRKLEEHYATDVPFELAELFE